MTPDSGSLSRERVRAVTAPASVVLVTLVMLAWMWSRCPDPIIDFGREIYIPWRITEGEVLYRDLNHFNGPLSPYFNAMIFRTFGVSLLTLKVANAIITLGVAMLVYRLMLELSDRLTAAAAGIAFTTVFACGHILGAANFNFLTPYSHELTHGVALALVMLACLWKASERQAISWLVLAGLALGLVLLTKAEIAFASLVGAATALALMLINRPRRLRGLLAFAVPALIVPTIAIALLSLAMPLSRAIVNCAGAWVWLGDGRIAGLPFFRWVLGTDHFQLNTGRMVLWVGRYGMIFVPAVVIGIALRGVSGRARAWIAAGSALAVATALVWWWKSIPWEGITRPLPLLLIIILTTLNVRFANSAGATPAVVLPLSLTTFSLAVLAKIFFNVHPFHYGFVLSMPGTMLLIVALGSWIPRWVNHLYGCGWVPRAMALAVLAVTIGGHVYTSGRWLARRNIPIAADADEFLSDDRGVPINAALEELRARLRPGDTLVVMPEGIMLNYLLRAPSPVRWQNFLPSEMMMYGEEAMLEALMDHPPTFIAVVHRDASEYDASRFGHDYATRVARWIGTKYELLGIEGEMPFESDVFGILLLRQKQPAASQPGTR